EAKPSARIHEGWRSCLLREQHSEARRGEGARQRPPAIGVPDWRHTEPLLVNLELVRVPRCRARTSGKLEIRYAPGYAGGDLRSRRWDCASLRPSRDLRGRPSPCRSATALTCPPRLDESRF